MKKGTKTINIFKILMIVLDIIAIIGLIFVTRTWIMNNKNNNPENLDKPNKPNVISSNQTISFKNLTIELPSGYEYHKLNNDIMVFDNGEYEIRAEMFIDREKLVFDATDAYYQMLEENDYNLSEYERMHIGNYDAIVFNRSNDGGPMLCYFEYNHPYEYEIEISKENVDLETLEPLFSALMTAKFNPNTDEKYYYVSISSTSD